MRQTRLLFTMVILFLPLLGVAPTTRQSQQRINDAIKALRTEFDDAKISSDLREQSNYFSSLDLIGAEALLDALEETISRDPVRECYVKWQLLSGIETFDGKLTPPAVALYRDASPFVLRPGISEEDRARLDALAAAATKADVYALTKRLESQVEKNVEVNRYNVAYRDALYRKLPMNCVTLLGRLEDLFERFQAGLEIRPEIASWTEDARRWSVSTDAMPAEMLTVAEATERMLLEDGPQYYAEADVDDGAVTWKKKRDSLRRSPKLKDLAVELRAQAEKPRGGLKFKDEK